MFTLSVFAWIADYALSSWGMYELALSRKIHHPWIAWIPVVRGWMLGCISDQYRYVQRGIRSVRRIALLALPILEAVLAVVSFCLGIFRFVLSAEQGGSLNTAAWIIVAVLALVRLLYFVLENLAVYDLHRSCNPSQAKLNLVLGMFIPCFRSIVIFLERDKELGMPPRTAQEE